MRSIVDVVLMNDIKLAVRCTTVMDVVKEVNAIKKHWGPVKYVILNGRKLNIRVV